MPQGSDNWEARLTPPSEKGSSDEEVKNDTNNNPLEQVVQRCRRDITRGVKDGWNDKVTEFAARVPPGKEVVNDYGAEANQPEVIGPGVSESCVSHQFN